MRGFTKLGVPYWGRNRFLQDPPNRNDARRTEHSCYKGILLFGGPHFREILMGPW